MRRNPVKNKKLIDGKTQKLPDHRLHLFYLYRRDAVQNMINLIEIFQTSVYQAPQKRPFFPGHPRIFFSCLIQNHMGKLPLLNYEEEAVKCHGTRIFFNHGFFFLRTG